MRIFDCFTYFNEKEVIELRFKELKDEVDFFVVVEASETFTGEPKPFYFDELELSSDILDKIIRVEIDFPYGKLDSWERETLQRNRIVSGITRAHEDDIIIISDADEIPNMETVKSLNLSSLPIRLDVAQYFWNYHWRVPNICNEGARPVVALKRHLDTRTPQELRAETLPTCPNGGWHFSFLLSEEEVRTKIEAFAHTEFDKDEFKDAKKILYRIENGIDPFDRFPLRYTEIDSTYPRSLQ